MKNENLDNHTIEDYKAELKAKIGSKIDVECYNRQRTMVEFYTGTILEANENFVVMGVDLKGGRIRKTMLYKELMTEDKKFRYHEDQIDPLAESIHESSYEVV